MATTKDYLEFTIDKLGILDNITYKPMMGEYLLYYNGILFGGIYDNRFLIKIVNNNQKYHLDKDIPYKGAKEMYVVDDINDSELLKKIILDTCKELKNEKNRRK